VTRKSPAVGIIAEGGRRAGCQDFVTSM